MDETPEPQPVDPDREPEQVRPSATGVVVPLTDESGNSSDDDTVPIGNSADKEM
jgi:hypothetical protein